MDDRLMRYLAAGEGMSVEFKRCGGNVEKDVFETVCSFANRQGGNIFLGVLDSGSIEGVPEKVASSIERNIVNVANNPKMFNTAPMLEMERIAIGEGRVVIRVWVPMGPSLYEFKGVVYDRIADVDVRVKTEAQKAAMIVRKQSFFTERTVYPWVTEDDLEMDLLEHVRHMVRSIDGDHPWLTMSDAELLRSARLYGRDPVSGERGFNLAAVVLLGHEETILDILPVYRTDAVLRRRDSDRYDDRLVCKSNLVRAYGELVGFCKKWMPDAFVLDGGVRVSASDVIIRELVANSLVHREYTSPVIASLVIDAKGVSTRNASRAMFAGPITLESLDPTPKNPVIANFFTQIGRCEELGSGTRSLYKFSRLYTGSDPELEDGDVFTAFVAIPAVMPGAISTSKPVGAKGAGRTRRRVEEVVMRLADEYGKVPASKVADEIQEVGARTVRRHLADMVGEGLLETAQRGRSTVYWRSGGSFEDPVS